MTCFVIGVWRLAFGVWRLAFGVWRLAFGVNHFKSDYAYCLTIIKGNFYRHKKTALIISAVF
jgi:hypothetical protein